MRGEVAFLWSQMYFTLCTNGLHRYPLPLHGLGDGVYGQFTFIILFDAHISLSLAAYIIVVHW